MKKALFITLLLLSINVAAQTNSKIVEIKKKAIYYELKLKIEIGKIDIKKAQKIWYKELRKLREYEDLPISKLELKDRKRVA
tara:strand:- start:185 stop:430 length:246 start_codon:yes stop_codon:yes gene_type:complete